MTVFVESVHSVRPITAAAFASWVDWYGEAAIPALMRNGHDVLGGWKRTTGGHGEDLLLMRYASLADVEKAVASIAKDPVFAKAREKRPPVAVREVMKAAAAVSYGTEQRLERQLAERPERPRLYMQAVLSPRDGRQREALDAVAELVDLVESKTDTRLVTAYETTFGNRPEFTDLWVSPTLNLAYRNRDADAGLMARIYDAAPDESTWILSPLPYSPLQ